MSKTGALIEQMVTLLREHGTLTIDAKPHRDSLVRGAAYSAGARLGSAATTKKMRKLPNGKVRYRVDLLTPAKAEKEKNPDAVALGRRGGLKGGPARAAALTPDQRTAIARRSAQKRWHPEKEGSAA